MNHSDPSPPAVPGTIPGDLPAEQLGIIIVDHGSRLEASNESLLEVVQHFLTASPYAIVEPAHMEIAEPTIGMAFDRCVQQGARFVVIHPYFLAPGKHWQIDIPRLAAEASQAHPGMGYLVTAPLGPHPTMCEIMQQRIDDAMATLPGPSAAGNPEN